MTRVGRSGRIGMVLMSSCVYVQQQMFWSVAMETPPPPLHPRDIRSLVVGFQGV